MAYSIYEVNDYSDIAKPSDLLSENDYTQDVFVMNRPEINYVDDRAKGNNHELENIQFDDQSYNYNPNNWDSQDGYLVTKSHELIGEYRLENDPVYFKFQGKAESNVRLAVTIADTMRATSSYSRERAPRTKVTLVKANKKDLRWVYLVKGYESWSDSTGHQVILKLMPDPKATSLNQMDMKVSCSCPFWKYQGPDFNAWRGNYQEGKPYSNLKNPDIRDPQRKNLICKHVYAVGLVIQKIIVKHNLDTQKDVDQVLKTVSDIKDSFLPEITLEGVEDIARRLQAPERKKLDNLLNKYKRELKDAARDVIFIEILQELKDQLDGQEKPFLVKLFHDIKNFFKVKTKEVEDDEKKEEFKEQREERREEKKNIEEEKKEDRQNKKEDKKKERQEKNNRRQKNLKKFIKKQSNLEDTLVGTRIANIMRMYLIETGDEYGDL